MVAYLIVSVLTGLGFAVTSFLGFDGGFWSIALWYVVGCWAGFAVSVAAFLIAGARQEASVPQWTAVR